LLRKNIFKETYIQDAAIAGQFGCAFPAFACKQKANLGFFLKLIETPAQLNVRQNAAHSVVSDSLIEEKKTINALQPGVFMK
jgi:hypothetical protein